MQWAVAAHGPAGKVRADRRTLEYSGRGNHARDAACFRTTRPVSAAAQATNKLAPTGQQQRNHKARAGKTLSTADDTRAGAIDDRGAARGDPKEAVEDDAALSLSKLRVFYYETLVVSTRDDDDETGDESDRDARAELEMLMARANAAAAAINSSTSTTTSTVNRATPHPYLNARTPGSRLPWRERARRIVHANLRAIDSLTQGNSSSSDESDGDDDHQMDLDSTGPVAAANSNGHDEESVPAVRSTTTTNGDGGRSFGIRQFLSATSSATPSGTAGTSSNHHSRLLSLATGASHEPRSSNTHSRSRSSSNNNSVASGANNSSTSTSSTNMNNVANGVHFAFTLSSRTLQQIRSRHERRRMRRHQEKKRFNHRIGIGFVLASKSNQGPSAPDGLSQVSTASSNALSNHSSSNSSASPLKKLASYQQQSKQVDHVDLGNDSFSLAYHGKTGRIVSNGQVFLQCEKFGSGDVVGCGVLLDTKTFFFTLNGRLLGMLAATDVHHFDDFVDDAEGGVVFGDDEDESDVEFVADEGDGDESDEELGDRSEGEPTLFEDVLYPAVSLHDAGECACANFNEFQFDLAGFERQILKERQQALLLHEIADEREEEANDRVINKLIQNYFLHHGYKDAYTVFKTSASFSDTDGYSSSNSSALVHEGIDVEIDEEEKSESMDMEASPLPLGASDPVQTKLLDLRHAVRQHIYAFQTQEALVEVCAALGDSFFQSTTRRRRGDKVLFYCRVLCVLDVLLAQHSGSPSGKAKVKAVNGGRTAGRNGNGYDSRDSAGWHAEEAILCAQEQFASYLAESSARPAATGEDSDMDDTTITTSKSPSLVAKSVVDDELELVMSLLLYERQEDVPAASVARKFLTPAFREHVADELNVILLVNNSPPEAKKAVKDVHQRRRSSPPPALVAAPARRDGSASALQNFLVELNALQSQCLRNGCRVFPGNHTVSSVGGKRSSSRWRRRHASASSSDNGEATNGDEEMRSSSSGSDMSSSSSRSENDDDDDEEEEE